MKKKLLSGFLLGLLTLPCVFGADYGLPAGIQEGNILHCFNWPAQDVKAALEQIAEAGFGTVQLSPLQRPDSKKGSSWHDLYRPYDLAFKSSAFCSEQDLKDLCAEAEKYGIKIIVDVVANHVDKTAGYHDPWWDSNGRVRWNGGINYGDRNSITHGQLGDYGDVNSESTEVAARGKAYVQKLKDLGVKGCRWDAAKHIGLPSEGCQFWKEVTSVPGMYHYGEILDKPGPNESIIKEYGTYMSVTDNEYCNYAAKSNGGIPGGHGGSWAVNHGLGDKVVYWGESHDTYSNDEWSQNVDQSVIDRAYAAYACRSGATALYLSRPNAKGFGNIKVGKGSTAFTAKHIAEVNKFRNVMTGKKDWFESNGNACSITRQNGGAVIVMKGSGNVSIANGGGYCPAGTYKDRVSGGTFTVTASTISGNVGACGIAVIYSDGIAPDPNPNPNPNPDPNPTPDPSPSGDMWILGNIEGHQWTPNAGAAMTLTDGKYVANGVKFSAATGETNCYFNITDALGADWDELNAAANRYGALTEGVNVTAGSTVSVTKYANNDNASACKSWTVAPGTYNLIFDLSAMTLSVNASGDNPDPNPNPNPNPDPNPTPDPTDAHYIYYDGTNFTQPQVWAWTDSANCTAAGKWGGDDMTKKDGKWYWELPSGKPVPTKIIIHEGDNKVGGGDLTYVDRATYHSDGTYTTSGNDDPNPPTPVTGTEIYVLGDFADSHWSTTAGKKMTADGNVYTITGLELAVNPNVAGATKAFFTFATKIGASWDDVNGADRYGASSKDEAVSAGSTVTVVKYPVNVSASSANSWGIEPGTYDITFDLGALKMTIANSGDNPQPVKPVVSASPASGTVFTDDAINVTLTSAPAATIYYTLNGTAATESSTKYTGPISITATTTINTLAVTAEGGRNSQTFTYTKKNNDDPIPPTPVGNRKNLITDYYTVNPGGKTGSHRTVTMNFNGPNSTTALSNWTEADLIAQGVARDVCQAFKGVHERPIVDSYALYAAYDSENLYLGVQYVYSVWDIGGEGKQPGESKPYNMDGKLSFAFDLDPNKSYKGLTNEGGSIWQNAEYTTFDNGSDAWWFGSTKPGSGTPGFFIPNEQGIVDYTDPSSCVTSKVKYGYADGLLPSITAVYGQDDFSYDPELLKGNTGFKDLRSEIADSAHTFYEFTFPLSMMGITEDYIVKNGIGVMVIDYYGSSAHSSIPYDPSFFDNVNESYSQDPSSSKEKEDKDLVTYNHAYIGKLGLPTSAEEIVTENTEPVYYTLQGVRVENPSKGLYIVVKGNKSSKVMIR